jgi:hypothetical protein
MPANCMPASRVPASRVLANFMLTSHLLTDHPLTDRLSASRRSRHDRLDLVKGQASALSDFDYSQYLQPASRIPALPSAAHRLRQQPDLLVVADRRSTAPRLASKSTDRQQIIRHLTAPIITRPHASS